VTVVAEAALPAVQALIRWDPATHADRELAEREALRFPPAVRMAALSGPGRAVAELLAAAVLPPEADVLGPIPLEGTGAGHDEQEKPAEARVSAESDEDNESSGKDELDGARDQQVRVLVRVPRSASMPLAAALQAAQGVRSARKDAGAVRVQLDPAELI
jgi:primosomal protein N' (replication factor Y) (superfamily II helicase)